MGTARPAVIMAHMYQREQGRISYDFMAVPIISKEGLMVKPRYGYIVELALAADEGVGLGTPLQLFLPNSIATGKLSNQSIYQTTLEQQLIKAGCTPDDAQTIVTRQRILANPAWIDEADVADPTLSIVLTDVDLTMDNHQPVRLPIARFSLINVLTFSVENLPDAVDQPSIW